jgi:rhamnosyltransferase
MVKRENTCAIIVSYNPTNDIFKNLVKHLEIFQKVIIIDNGTSQVIFEQLESFSKAYDQIELISLNKNYGIAYALNCGIKRGLKLKFTWIVSFDQDSFPSDRILEYYNKVIEDIKDKSIIGLIGGSFSFSGTSLSHESITWNNSLSIITSGTLYNCEIFGTTGFFDEKLFIDSVDFEFNLRVRKNKFLTIKIDQPIINHTLGNPIERNILNITLKSTNHGYERRYYMARNHVIITKRYFFNFPGWILKKNYFFIKSLFQILIVEQDVKLKLHNILLGLKDGILFKEVT